MLPTLTEDQEFFRETTARFLEQHAPVAELRRLRDHPGGFEAEYWQRGAELGWTTLLVSEEMGGGSVSEHGLVDLSLIAYEFGRRAAPGPLVTANLVAGALSEAGCHPGLVEALVGGAIASWCHEEGPPHDGGAEVQTEIRPSGSELVITGLKRPVESAGQASHFLVTGQTGGGLSQAVVPADADGISIRPLRGIDQTQRYFAVEFDGVRVPADAAVGTIGEAASAIERQLQQALVLVNAQAVGAMRTAFDVTVEWAFDRYSFGRPLASYQALKHRYALMKTWLEASRALNDEAVDAVANRSGNAQRLASAAKAYISETGTELGHDCVQMHGGIGVTYEHDIHLYLRRIAVGRALFGSAAAHRQAVGDLVLEEIAADQTTGSTR